MFTKVDNTIIFYQVTGLSTSSKSATQIQNGNIKKLLVR